MDTRAAAAAVVAHLTAAAVYVEDAGRLRCVAHRGLDEVADGLPLGAEVPGGGRTARFDGGLLYAEGGAAQAEVTRCAEQLRDRLSRADRPPAPAALARLARSVGRLQGTVEADVSRAVVDVAVEVAATASVMLVLAGPSGGLHVAAAAGPRAAGWRALPVRQLQPFLGSVASSPSCVVVKEDVVVAAVVRDGRLGGALVAACTNDEPVTEAMELLAEQAGAALEVAALIDELRDRASRDPLTGLANVTAFRAALASATDRPSVVVADIDGFDSVNRVAGHLAGDRVLRALSAVLAAEVRGADRLYRAGGDEFAALLHGVDTARAQAIGSRLCAAAATVLAEHGAALSAGVAVPGSEEPSGAVLARAEAAAKAAKRTAPGTCVLAPAG